MLFIWELRYLGSPVQYLMARRKKRQYNWQHLKSILWQERKEGGLYQYNSPNFNKLVTEVYESTGKKNPKKNLQSVAYAAQTAEAYIFEQVPTDIAPVPYFDIARQLQNFQDEVSLTGYMVKTDFRTDQFPDQVFALQNFEYEGSDLQELVNKTDRYRKENQYTLTPPAKFIFKIDSKKKIINIYINEAPPEPQFNEKGKRVKRYGGITTVKTKQGIIDKTKRKESNLEKISENKKDLRNKEAIFGSMIANNMDKSLLANVGESMNELYNENKKLTKENAEIDKYLSQSEGYKIVKPKNKKTKNKGAAKKHKNK